MYTPAYSKLTDEAELLSLMRGNPFAALISMDDSGLQATHLPVVVKDLRTLQMHMARPNPQWRALDGRPALVIFSGPHAYISPAWYADPATVPTWNYAAVHAHGIARLFEGDELRRHLEELVEVSEAAAGTGWSMSGTPEKYLAGLQHGIVGVELAVTRLEGKQKMSQNRDEATDGRRVIAALRATPDAGNHAVAAIMERIHRGTGC